MTVVCDIALDVQYNYIALQLSLFYAVSHFCLFSLLHMYSTVCTIYIPLFWAQLFVASHWVFCAMGFLVLLCKYIQPEVLRHEPWGGIFSPFMQMYLTRGPSTWALSWDFYKSFYADVCRLAGRKKNRGYLNKKKTYSQNPETRVCIFKRCLR